MKRTTGVGSAMTFALLAWTMFSHWTSAGAQAIDDSWIGGAGQWNVAANWSSGEPLNGSPSGATYNVFISNGGAVTMNNGLNSSTPIDNLTVGSSSSLAISDGNNLTITGSTLANAGVIALNSGGHATYIVIGAPSVTLSGGGTITMSNDAGNFIVGSATANTLTNEETIRGAGSIGGGNGSTSLTLVNSGIIDANQSVGMTIQANGGTTNTGTLESTAGSTLTLSGTFTNTGGTISAGASDLKFLNATINGGAVRLSGDSTLQLENATIHSGSTLTNSATGLIEATVDTNNTLGGTVNNSAGGVIQIDNDATVNLEKGTYANLGAVTLNSTGFETVLGITGTKVTLSGGTVTMSNSAANFIAGSATANTLTNEETIQGSGSIGGGNGSISLTLVNSGVIDADQSVPLTVQAAGGVKNTGTLEATGGSTLALSGVTVTNTGGTISADSSELHLTNAAVAGGAVTLTGASTLQLSNGTVHGGTLTNSATGVIEAMAGTSNTLGGSVDNSAGGVLQVNNDSTLNLQNGSYTKLGTVTLNSTVNQTSLVVDGAKVTLSGGTVTMSNSAANYIFGAATADTLTNQESISGAGHIGNGQMTLTNSGTINSDDSAGMVIQANGGAKNTGTLEATAGSTMALTGMTVTNTSGTISADASQLQVTNATINGGAVTLTAASTLKLSNGVIHSGSTLTNSAAGLIEAASGTSTLGGKVINPVGGVVQIDNAAALNLESGTYSKLGAVTLNSTANQTSLIIDGANVALSGGSVTMTNNVNNYIFGAASTDTLTNQETISGAGHIGGGQMTLVNSGTINADQAAGMVIQTSGAFTNNGTLTVSSGDLMHILGGTFTNFSSGTLTGGTYNTSGTLEIDQLGSNGGEIATNAAKIFLNGTGSKIVDAAGKSALANISTNASAGTFSLAGGQTLTTAGSFTNAGKFTVATGSSFTVGGPAIYTQTSGTTTANGTLAASGGVNLQAGSLYGSGSISGNISSSGLVAPGQSTGTTGILSDTGAYTQNAAGSLDISIGGATAGTKFDELKSTTATLGGTLNIDLINGFMPTIGSKFKIVDYSSEAGQFATVNGLAINSSEHFSVAYQGTDVLLTVVSGAAPSSPRSLSSIATLGARTAGDMKFSGDHFALAAGTSLRDLMNSNSRALGEQPADRGMPNHSADPANQVSSLAFAVTAATEADRLGVSSKSGFRVPKAFATMPEHHATFASIVSAKAYASSALHSNIDTRARVAGKVARSNLQFSLPNLYSRPRVSLSLD